MATLRRSTVFRFLTALALGSIALTTLLPGLAFAAPIVAITRPLNGAVVSGQIWIDVNFSADKNLPIVRLEVYIDDQLSREFDLAQPMLIGHQTFSWDFSYASNSVHKIGAKAIDSGNNAGAASISVTVQNAAATGPDQIPPVVHIYYPAQGATVSGRTEIKADAQDNVGVEMVVFYIDGKLHKVMMNAPPYVDSWDTTREMDGRHVLEATAVDKAENEQRSAQVTVIVENRNMTATAGTAGMSTLGAGGASLPTTPPSTGTTPTPQPVAPMPQPVEPAAPPAPAPTPTAKLPDTLSAPPAPPAPPLVTVVPWAPPATIPSAPPATTVPGGPGSPVAIGTGRQGGLAALAPRTPAPAEAASLPRPGVTGTQPGPTGSADATPKTTAPRDTAALPVPPAPVAPLLPLGAPTVAAGAPLLPLAATAAAPSGDLRYDMTGRLTAPGAAPAGKPGPAKSARDASRVVPIGPTVATTVPTTRTVQPVRPVATAPNSGLSRVTTPAAPERVASGLRPPAAPLVVDAALAEYRGLPVPAERMLARLPDAQTGKLSADGRTTRPSGDIAAVPIAIRKVTDIKIVFDGEVLSLRATPETRRGISLAPLRKVFEQTDGVLYWFPVEKKVHAVNKSVDMKLQIGAPEVMVNGEQRTLLIAPYIKQGRTMVPLQFIADVLDVNIAVDSATGQITISSNQL